MYEIITRGSVTASFLVYDDFYEYVAGVYFHTTSKYRETVIVKILGYGYFYGYKYGYTYEKQNRSWFKRFMNS